LKKRRSKAPAPAMPVGRDAADRFDVEAWTGLGLGDTLGLGLGDTLGLGLGDTLGLGLGDTLGLGLGATLGLGLGDALGEAPHSMDAAPEAELKYFVA